MGGSIARSDIFTMVFFLKYLKLKVNYMQEFILTFFVTNRTQIFFRVAICLVNNIFLSRVRDFQLDEAQ